MNNELQRTIRFKDNDISIDKLDKFNYDLNKDNLNLLKSIQKERKKETDIKISDTMPVEGNSSTKNEIRNEIEKIKSEKSLIRSKILIPEKNNLDDEIMSKRTLVELIKLENNFINKLTIYEIGVVLEMIINKTPKEEAIKILQNYSDSDFNTEKNEPILYCSKLDISLIFNNQDILIEIKFGNNYQGSTSEGLKLNDSLDKAIEIYGQPLMKSKKGAIWQNISVFCVLNNIINSITLK